MNPNSSQSHRTGIRLLAVLPLLAATVGAADLSSQVQAAVVHHGCGAAGITAVSPDNGDRNTIVTITGCGLGGATQVLFGNVAASFHVDSPTTITAYAANGVPAGSTVPVSTVATSCWLFGVHKCFEWSSKPLPSAPTATFSYAIGFLEMFGPYPHFFNEGSTDSWFDTGVGNVESFDMPGTLPFAMPSQTFHIATEFSDESSTFRDGQQGVWGPNGLYEALGDKGTYGASLQVCDVATGVDQHYGNCTNWDGTTGYWKDVPNTYVSDELKSPGGDGTALGDLALNAPAPDPSETNSDHVATYRIGWSLQESDEPGTPPEYRSISGVSGRFNAIWAPVAYAQMTVLPYTIFYHPTGDLSKVAYTTNLGFGTDYKMSNGSIVSNSYKDTNTNSTNFEESITAAIFGVNFDDSYNWDRSTSDGFGSTVSTSDETTDSTAIKTTWGFDNPDNSLVPGDGATCAPPAHSGGSWDCLEADLVHPSDQLKFYMNEPFWEDVFLLNLHPQYRIYQVGSGESLWTIKAAVPTLAHISVLQLEDCRIGNWSAGVDPCLVEYGGVNITYNGNVSYKPTSCNDMPPQTPEDSCIELTSQDAANLLALDPFYGAGQAASVQTSRAIPISPNVGSYGASYPYNEKNPLDFTQSWDNTHKTTSGSGAVLTATTGYSDVNATDVGGGFTLSQSTGKGGISEKGAMTLTTGEQTQTDYSQETQYQDSTANSTTQETTAGPVDLNDFDNTTTASPACAKCHDPMPQQPEVNVYLDRALGGFMYQDPNAPGPPGGLNHKIGQYRKYLAIHFFGYLDGQAVSRERFTDIRGGDPAAEAIDVLTYLNYMRADANDRFRPTAPMRRLQLATALAGMVHLSPTRVLKMTYGGSRGSGNPVTEAAFEKGLIKALKIKKRVAMRYMKAGFHTYSANRTANRRKAAEVLFAALQSSCIEGCSYNKLKPAVATVPNRFSVALGPAGGTVPRGDKAATTVKTSLLSGVKQTLKLRLRGLPPGARARLQRTSIAAGKSSKLTIKTAAGTPAGTYAVTVIATARHGARHTTTYELSVKPVKVASQFNSLGCSSSGSTNISCQGSLGSGVITPAGGPTPLANRIVTIAYTPPDGSSPVDDIALTDQNGNFSDTLSTSSGGPLTPGTWQVRASYGGDATTNATTSPTQSVIVRGS